MGDGTGLVFPSVLKPGSPMSDMTLTKVLRSTGLAERATVHGFRSSFKNWTLEQTDTPWAVSEAALAHMLGNSTEQAYARSDLFERRRALMQLWADYLTARGVTTEAIRARGYREVHGGNPIDGDFAKTYGFPKVRGGLLIPLHPLLGGEAYQLRFKPGTEPLDRKGKPRKFDTPGGQRNVMATSPLTRDLLDAPRQAIVIAEGITRVDAVAPLGIPAVGIPGVWSWRGTNAKGGKTALADFDNLAIEGNVFILAYDADMRTNADVNAAALRLAAQLLGRGAASVSRLALPDGMGLDDWVAAQRSARHGRRRDTAGVHRAPIGTAGPPAQGNRHPPSVRRGSHATLLSPPGVTGHLGVCQHRRRQPAHPVPSGHR